MKRVEVRSIHIEQGSLYSLGSGLDSEGDPVSFIGHTGQMINIKKDLDDYEDNPEHGPPYIHLEAWQEQ